MNFVDSLNLFGIEAKELPCIKGKGAPSTATVGAVGLFYMDTDTGDVYKCTAAADGAYTWTELVGTGGAGEDGGYYTPTVTQLDEKTMEVAFKGSKDGMPVIDAANIILPAGPVGATPKFHVGTVITGEAGADAGVSITGSDAEPVLRFVIPRGPKGDTGPHGPQGPAGSDASVTAANIAAALGHEPADKAEVDVLGARMDTFAALGEGSTTGDAELVDARVDIEGKVWANVGGHLRGITGKIVDACCDKVIVEGDNYNLFKTSEVSFSTRLQDDVEGTVSSNVNNAVTGWMPVEYGKYYALSVLYDGSRTTQPGGAGSQYTRMNAQKSDGTVLVYNKGSVPITSEVEHSKQVLTIESEDITAIRLHFNVNTQDISTAELLKSYEPMFVAGDTAEEAYQNAVGLPYIDGDAKASAEVEYSLKHDETKADKTETAELRERLAGSEGKVEDLQSRLIGSMEIPTEGALVGTMVSKDLAISSGTAVNAAYANGIVSDYIPCLAGSTVTVDSSDYTFQVMEYQVEDAPAVYSGVLNYGTTYTVTQDGYVRICIRYVDTTLSADTNLFKHVVANISGYYDLSEFAKKTADPTTSPYYRNVDFGMVPFAYYHGVGADYEAEGFGKDTQYADFLAAWRSLVAGHSTYVTETELGAASDGQMLYLFDLSPVRPDKQKTPIPKIIITAGQHGWEKADVYGLFYFVRDLLSSWNKHPALEYLRNHVHLMIVPVVNPYGFDHFCYKNGNEVNINRNYDSNWVLVDDAASQQYGGAEPFDQPESQIVRDLILNNEDTLMVVDFHTCSGDVATSYDTMTYYGVCASTDNYYSRMQDAAAHQLSAASANFNMDYDLGQPDTIMGYINMNPGNGILRSWATDNGIIGVLVEGFTGFPGRTAFSGEVLKANDEIIANYLVTALYYLSR